MQKEKIKYEIGQAIYYIKDMGNVRFNEVIYVEKITDIEAILSNGYRINLVTNVMFLNKQGTLAQKFFLNTRDMQDHNDKQDLWHEIFQIFNSVSYSDDISLKKLQIIKTLLLNNTFEVMVKIE